jgi:DNA-binding NarL/FixJ family response regulator
MVIRLLIADDQALVRGALAALLARPAQAEPIRADYADLCAVLTREEIAPAQ